MVHGPNEIMTCVLCRISSYMMNHLMQSSQLTMISMT